MREYWLDHPVGRVLTLYRLEDGVYERSQVGALSGETPVAVLAGVVVRWEPVLERLLPLE